jgi:serine/threonine protein kinase
LVPHSDLEPVRKLGGGHFGEVWLMMWCKTTKVAVKWLKGANTDEEFRKEIRFSVAVCFTRKKKLLFICGLFRLLRKIKHPHIVSYYGLSSDPATSVLRLVTEFVEGGSLLEWLREESSSYPQSCYFRVSQEICAGMEHISKKGIVHRDLAARNILVRKVAEKEVLVKLCDFGLGRVLDADTYVMICLFLCVWSGSLRKKKCSSSYYIRDATAIMPIKWSAPEALEFRKFSTKSDVFSFGVVMWEVWSHGADPYSGWPQTKILKRLKKGERLDIPYQCSDEVYALMMECWQLDAKLRPTWKELFEKLESLLANYEDKVCCCLCC